MDNDLTNDLRKNFDVNDDMEEGDAKNFIRKFIISIKNRF